MSIARDAFSKSAFSTATPITFTHTPVGTPRAIVVIVNVANNGTDVVTSVTYGGVSMTEVTNSPNLLATSEIGGIHVFFLGANIPTGAQTVSITCTAGANKIGYCISYTAAGDCAVKATNVSINSTSSANPSSTLALGSTPCAVVMGLHSGQADPTGITELANWTAESEDDPGSNMEACYSYNIVGTADVTIGWTQTADDALALAVAVFEQTVASALSASGTSGGTFVGDNAAPAGTPANNFVPVRVSSEVGAIPTETVTQDAPGVVPVRTTAGTANVVPIRNAPTEVPRVKIRQV